MHFNVTTLALITAALGLPKSDEQPIVLRAYDITTASPFTQPAAGSTIPLIRSEQSDDLGPVTESARSEDTCIDILTQLQAAEWELPDRSLRVGSNGRLVVSAPAPLQDAVALTLGFMSDTFGRRTHLVFDVVTTKLAEADSMPAQVAVSDLARWISSADSHQSFDVEFAPGEHGRVRAQRAVDIVRAYNTEIAERSTAFAPVEQRLMTGLALECSTAPAPGGSWLALALQDVTPSGGVQDAEARNEGRITTDSGNATVRGPSRVQRLPLDERILALNAYLPDGKALAVRTSLDLDGAKATRIVFVHQGSAAIGAVARLPDDVKRALGPHDAAFVRTDAYVLPRARVFTGLGEARLLLDTLSPSYPKMVENRYARPGLEQDSSDELLDLMSSFEADRSVISAGTWAVLLGPDRASIDGTLAKLSTLLPDPRSFQATISLKRGSRASETVARAVLAVRPGARSTLVLGRETTENHMINTYIANGASASSTTSYQRFDGIAVSVEPRVTSKGDLDVLLIAHAAAPHGQARQFDFGVSSIAPVDQQDTDALDDVRTVTFAKSDKGPKRIVLGNNGTSEEALTLEVEITELH
jgi:hypothetical protein